MCRAGILRGFFLECLQFTRSESVCQLWGTSSPSALESLFFKVPYKSRLAGLPDSLQSQVPNNEGQPLSDGMTQRQPAAHLLNSA